MPMKYAVLTITRYPSWHILTALHSMALFRLPLIFNKKISFFKLLGCGRNGSFDLQPDWRQYGIFTVSSDVSIPAFTPAGYEQWKRDFYGSFITRWWRFFGCETWTILLEPQLSHGSWAGKEVFPNLKKESADGPVCVLTRATIRANKARDFWKNVAPVQNKMADAKGLLYSVGIGEMPFLRQATFSIWQDESAMKSFAYSMAEHRDVIKKTRDRRWYSEEMFTRFRPLAWCGKLNGASPLNAELVPTVGQL
jgi:hypothetical protein